MHIKLSNKTEALPEKSPSIRTTPMTTYLTWCTKDHRTQVHRLATSFYCTQCACSYNVPFKNNR